MPVALAGLVLSAAALTQAPAMPQTQQPAANAASPAALVADPASAPSATGAIVLPALTQIELETVDMVSSGRQKPGDFFSMRVVVPVKVGEVVLIPAGTPATGQVVHAAKRGMSGKAGELILAARFVELAGQQIKLRATISGAGKSNQDRAAAVSIAVSTAVPVASFIGLMIQGKDMVLPAGTRVITRTAAAVEMNAAPAAAEAAASPAPAEAPSTPESNQPAASLQPTDKDQPAP